MPQPLKLTSQEIAEHSSTTSLPGVALTIDTGELAPEQPSVWQAAPLQITSDDITAIEPAAEVAPKDLEQLMFSLVNQARRQYLPSWLGRDQLKWHALAATVARQHTSDMVSRDYLDHVSPDGLNVGRRLDRAHVSYLACGENIGLVVGPASHGRQGVYEIQQAFMNQPSRLTNHRGNILNPMWTHLGIGACFAPEGKLYLTQIFITTLVGER